MTPAEGLHVTTPAPQPGQVWRPQRPGSRAKAREVVFVGKVPGLAWMDSTVVGFSEDGNDDAGFSHGEMRWHSWVWPEQFRAWVRRHDARVVTP